MFSTHLQHEGGGIRLNVIIGADAREELGGHTQAGVLCRNKATHLSHHLHQRGRGRGGGGEGRGRGRGGEEEGKGEREGRGRGVVHF